MDTPIRRLLTLRKPAALHIESLNAAAGGCKAPPSGNCGMLVAKGITHSTHEVELAASETDSGCRSSVARAPAIPLQSFRTRCLHDIFSPTRADARQFCLSRARIVEPIQRNRVIGGCGIKEQARAIAGSHATPSRPEQSARCRGQELAQWYIFLLQKAMLRQHSVADQFDDRDN